MRLARFIPEVTVFVCGAVVMVYELVGTRILGPYFGTSLYIWTNLIGIFLGSLSIGYYFGGKLADKSASLGLLSRLVLYSGALIALSLIIKDTLLVLIAKSITNPGTGSAIASILLFLPSGLILGMISPVAGKIKINSLSSAGSSLGLLYAVSTAGSIVGTYLAGFYLIPTVGTNNLLLVLSVILILLSFIISRELFFVKIFSIILVYNLWIFIADFNQKNLAKNFIDVDTSYNRVWIYQTKSPINNLTSRVMGINAENHSSMYLENDALVNKYTRYFHLARHFVPGFKSALMLGGAGYSFPKDYLRLYPGAKIDVVEIDPEVTDLARKYFRLVDHPDLNIIHQDARIYLNQSDKKYDVIFNDVYSSRNEIPFHLTTKEAVEKMHGLLSERGVIITNIISAIDGDRGKFLRAEYATYKSIFPNIYIFVVNTKDPKFVQNIIMVATKSNEKFPMTSADLTVNEYLESVWKYPIVMDMDVLRDDFAPVEYYINELN